MVRAARGDRGGEKRGWTIGSAPHSSDRTSTCAPEMCEGGRQHSQRSPSPAPSRASEARADASSASAVSSTPLGAPVEPDVAMISAAPDGTPSG